MHIQKERNDQQVQLYHFQTLIVNKIPNKQNLPTQIPNPPNTTLIPTSPYPTNTTTNQHAQRERNHHNKTPNITNQNKPTITIQLEINTQTKNIAKKT